MTLFGQYRSPSETQLDSLTRPGDTLMRLIGLSFILFGLWTSSSSAGTQSQRVLILVLGGVCSLAWLLWTVAPWLVPHRRLGAANLTLLLVFGSVGSVLTGQVPGSTGSVFPAVAAMILAMRTRQAFSAWCTGAFVVIGLVNGFGSGHVASSLAWSTMIVGLYGLGQSRRSRALRLEAVEQLLTETERANSEHALNAALAERSRIAREIHDVLAHSLAALTVQLEAADALLSGGNPDRAHEYVVKARRIAREGLVETRRAITALREDSPPLPALLDSLAENYRTDLGVKASVTVVGEPRQLSAESALAVYRTAQESLTNVRKHAPGAEVELTLAFEPEQTRLTVANGPGRGEPSALAGSGGGYGLTGLRERAELAAGTLTAHAVDPEGGNRGWSVELTIPALN
jgi:signal transduction histidine kinase